MSKKRSAPIVSVFDADDRASSVETGNALSTVFQYFRERLWLSAIVGFLVIGVLGAVLKYLDEDAQHQKLVAVKDRSLISKVNPFLAYPTATPTPQLSRELLYAGSRLLAVEDANANAAPPADLAVWRPSSGVWWVMGPGGSIAAAVGWGTSGDIPSQGDFDGDGKTDFAIFRPSTGTWWIMQSSDNSYYSVSFGSSGDIPVAADYDGDGKTDVAVFRPSTNVWYIIKSSDSSVEYVSFGTSGDTPTPADYDGDGKADISVWRDSNTTFYTMLSTTASLQSATFGNSGDKPVCADYDGDGKANYAVRHNADWIIMNAALSSTTTTTPSGDSSSDMPVPNDYDGDGKVDIAVWRPSTGYWYIRQSSDSSLRAVQWGANGDTPVPLFWRR